MSDPNTTGPAPLDIRPVKRRIWQRLSLVWLVPLVPWRFRFGPHGKTTQIAAH